MTTLTLRNASTFAAAQAAYDNAAPEEFEPDDDAMPLDAFGEPDLEEIVMYLADDMTHETSAKDFEQTRRALRRAVQELFEHGYQLGLADQQRRAA